MNNTIMKGIIIILLLALIRVSFRYTEMKSMLIQCQETCAEMQVINDGLIDVNNELLQEVDALNDILNDIAKEESKDAGNVAEQKGDV